MAEDYAIDWQFDTSNTEVQIGTDVNSYQDKQKQIHHCEHYKLLFIKHYQMFSMKN